MNRRRRIFLIALLAVGIVGSIAFVFVRRSDRMTGVARGEWKNQAITRIEKRSADDPWIKSTIASSSQSGWNGDELLMMKNGEWIICQSICSKQNWFIHDLFVGKGSDGKWYYSTFHFCINKTVLRDESQPETLAQFVSAYWLTPFDGKSDACLQTTWTGEPWGAEKLAADE
jgi:hypothetical protein